MKNILNLEKGDNGIISIYNIIIFIVVLATGVGNYVVSTYKIEANNKKIEKHDKRLKELEKINYELILKQLEDMEEVDKELNASINNKLEKTNERIDKVLQILVNN